jgi:hypothetical protein
MFEAYNFYTPCLCSNIANQKESLTSEKKHDAEFCLKSHHYMTNSMTIHSIV